MDVEGSPFPWWLQIMEVFVPQERLQPQWDQGPVVRGDLHKPQGCSPKAFPIAYWAKGADGKSK